MCILLYQYIHIYFSTIAVCKHNQDMYIYVYVFFLARQRINKKPQWYGAYLSVANLRLSTLTTAFVSTTRLPRTMSMRQVDTRTDSDHLAKSGALN